MAGNHRSPIRGNIFGAPTHEHRPITINGNMTACADCGAMIIVPPKQKPVPLTRYIPTDFNQGRK